MEVAIVKGTVLGGTVGHPTVTNGAILRHSWILSGTTCVNRHQKGKTRNKNPKVISEEPHHYSSWQRITTPLSPHWLQWYPQHLLPKLPIPLQWSPHPSNTLTPRPIPLTTPNGIQIKSAVFHNSPTRLRDWPTGRQTDRLTDGKNDKSVPTPAYALLIV